MMHIRLCSCCRWLSIVYTDTAQETPRMSCHSLGTTNHTVLMYRVLVTTSVVKDDCHECHPMHPGFYQCASRGRVCTDSGTNALCGNPNILHWILKYKTTYPHPVMKQQPTNDYGMAYLCHGGTNINKRYDEEITYYYNWPKSTRHCCKKILCSTYMFNLVNWKAFQHQGKRLNKN
jgi:hypothetical protein